MCDCIKITYHVIGDPSEPITIQTNVSGTLNGYNTYEFTYLGVTYYIWHDAADNWYVSLTLGVLPIISQLKANTNPCPLGSIPVWTPNSTFDIFTIEECPIDCGCGVVINADINKVAYLIDMNPSGLLNGQNVFQGIHPTNGNQLSMWFNGVEKWVLTYGNILIGENLGLIAELIQDVIGCPFSTDWENETNLFRVIETTEKSCICTPREDRIFRQYEVVKLPDTFIEQNRGLKDCCCSYYVLGSPDQETWKKDKTSAWIKLSGLGDTHTFTLYKNGQPTTYVCPNYSFVNEANAFYTTIEWSDVLESDGVGCYTLKVEFEISGITGDFTWGKYDLKPYTIQNALKTARIKAIFNGYHEVDQIDFTASNVESTHRFFGYIGNRQPNTEIDNIIYDNREMKRVIRENLNDYEIITEPSDECIIRPMIELYLLSENQLFISDYNAHNHSYRYLDLPVIVSESAQIEYKDLSRKATLTCKVSDKFKTNRTYYNG